MKAFVIGKTRPRWVIALVVLVTFAGAAMTGCGASETIIDTTGALAGEPEWLRRALGMVLWLLLGAFALQAVVTSEKYWELTEERIRYRSSAVRISFLRYAWDVLRGREPEADVELVTDDVVRIRLSWRAEHAALAATRGLPVTVFPITVVLCMKDGTEVAFERLGEDAKTLGAALRYLADRPGVTLDDADDLLDHMAATAGEPENLYEYLEGLHNVRTAKSSNTADRSGSETAMNSANEPVGRKGRR